MILVYVVLAAIFASYITGGRFKHYVHHELRGLWLPIAAFMLEAL